MIVFNNVSLYGDNYDPTTIQHTKQKDVIDAMNSSNERIEEFKNQLKVIVKSSFLHPEISDEILFGDKEWRLLKKEVLESEEYRQQKWYIDLTIYEK